MDDSQRATLRDIINYEPEAYLNEDEIKIIQDTFRNNNKLITILRKIMLPTMSDPSLPVEEIANDVYLAGLDVSSMQVDEVKAIFMARQDAVKFIIGGLIKLKMLASNSAESPYNKELRKKKDSNK